MSESSFPHPLHLLVTTLILCLLLGGCKKEDEYTKERPNNSVFLNSCLDNYQFDEGSYWVYKESSGLAWDSTYVTRWNFSEMLDYFGTRESVSISYESTRREPYGEIYFGGAITTNRHPPWVIESEAKFVCSAELIDSLSVGNSTYYGVLKGIENDTTQLYYKEGIGVIKIVEYFPTDTFTYDLIKHQVQLAEVPR